jgi:flagellin
MALSINSQSPELGLLSILNMLNRQQSLTMERLATAKRVNRASDDPAGLIAISNFNMELSGVDAALGNANRADAMLNVADGAITQISSLLTEIKTLVTQSAGDTLTEAEKAANQMEIDSAIDAIDRIVGTTTFNGERLLDGSAGVRTSMSGADAAKIRDVQVYTRPPGDTTASLTVNVTAAATRATTAESGWVDMSGDNVTLSAETTLSITGKLGSTSITLAAGSTQTDVIDAINEATALTGVSATASSTAIRLESQDYGSDSIISVSVLSGDEDFVGSGDISQIEGTDAVVTVNGASAGVDGTSAYWSGTGYSVSFTLADNTTGTRTINVTGGGATFQLGTDSSTRSTIGIGSLYSQWLGKAGIGYLSELKSGGSKDLSHDIAGAAAVVSQAVNQVASTAARIGGFQAYEVKTAINVLSKTKEGLTDARGSIEDADLAAETANLSRYRTLMDTVTSLFKVASDQRQSILSLLD